MSRMRWLLVGLMFFSSTIGYMDRAAIGIAAPMIAAEFHLTLTELGFALSAFFAGYAIFAVIGGSAADRFGPRRVIVLSMGLWSLFCGLTGAAGGLVSLVIARFVFGIGEGPFGPSQVKMVGRWFPRKEQATAISVYGSGEAIGGALAGPLVATLAVLVSWRASFFVMAAAGFLLLLLWAFFVTEWPEQNRHVGEPERKLITDSRASEATIIVSSDSLLSACLRIPVLAIALAWFGYGYVLFFFLSWFPTYLTQVHHLSITGMGFVSSLPWLAGFVGRTTSGFVSDLFYRRTGDALLSRKLVLCTGLTCAAVCIALAGTASNVVAAVGLTSVSVFFLASTATIYWALMLDLVDQGKVGGVSGFGLFVGSSAGVVAPTLTGYLVQLTGAFSSAFLLAGAIALTGALAVYLFVRTPPAPARFGAAAVRTV